MGRIRPYGYQVQHMLIKRSFAIIPFSFFFWMNRLFSQQKYGKFIVTFGRGRAMIIVKIMFFKNVL